MGETIAEIAARSGDHRYLALVLTTLSGVATGIGGLAILWSGEPSFIKLGHMLSFSAGVMMYISFVDLLFKSIDSLGFTVANAAVICSLHTHIYTYNYINYFFTF